MFIEKIAIESFGSLSQVTYDLTEGINIFRGDNESGKSTIAAFIKFIFYGLCGKIPDQTLSEKARYTNWDHGISGGNLVINENGKRYRIERRLTPAAKAVGKEKVKIIDLESGAEVHKGACPGEVFFGVSEEIFSQTAFSAQGSGSLVDSEKMNNAIDNILFSGNESVSVKSALKKLDDARIFLLHKNKKGGKIYTMDCEIEELKGRIRQAEDNEDFLAAKNRTLADNRRQIEEDSRVLKETSDKLKQYEATTVLARFDALDRKKEAYRVALAEGKRLQEASAHDGFVPDHEYRDRLRAIHADLGIAEKEAASLEAQKQAFAITSLTPEQHAILSEIEAFGGMDAAKEAIGSVSKRRKSRVRSTVIFGAITLVFAVAALLFGIIGLAPSLPAPVGYALYGITALSAILTAVLAVTLTSLKASDQFRRFFATNLPDAIRNMENAIKAQKVIGEEDIRHNQLIQSLKSCEAKQKRLYDEAAHLMEKWGLTLTDRASILAAAEKAGSAVLQFERAAQSIRDAKLTFEAAESALSGFSREKYAALKEETAYVGDVPADAVNELKLRQNFFGKKVDALKTQIRTLELEIASRSAITENSAELKEVLAEQETLRKEYADKYDAYLLAYQSIKDAGEHLRARIAPTLSQTASELVKAATKGRYSDIGIDNSLAVSFRTDETSPGREVGFMSAGTKALTYISFRLALIQLLFNDKTPTTVFDEAFASLDNDRLAAVMSLLSDYAKTSQVILMSCHDREYEACADKDAVNLIEVITTPTEA